MTVHAKEIVDGRFWILEDHGMKIATIALSDNKFILADKKGSNFYKDKKALEQHLGNTIEWDKLDITESVTKEIHGFPCSTTPFNQLYDVKKKLPLFTKSKKSKSLYCAGYYVIQFDKGWVKSFCPKLITLERYNFKGPFTTKLEMKQELAKLN